MSIKDKERLNKMLLFWEERNILPLEVMQKMRKHVGVPIVKAVQQIKPTPAVVSSHSFNSRHVATHPQTAMNNVTLHVNLNNQIPSTMNNNQISFSENKHIPLSNEALVLEQYPANILNAFICERPVLVSLNRARDVCNEIQSNLKLNSLTTQNDTILFLNKFNQMIETAHVRPPLPAILLGKLLLLLY